MGALFTVVEKLQQPIILLPNELYVLILNFLEPYDLYNSNCIVYFYTLITNYHYLYQLLSFFHSPLENIKYFPPKEFILQFFRNGNHFCYQKFPNNTNQLLQIQQIEERNIESFTTLLFFINFDMEKYYSLHCINNFIKEQYPLFSNIFHAISLVENEKFVHFEVFNTAPQSLIQKFSFRKLCKISPIFCQYLQRESLIMEAIQINIQSILFCNINKIAAFYSKIQKQLLQYKGLVFLPSHFQLFHVLFPTPCQELVEAIKLHPSLFQFIMLEAETLEYCIQRINDEELKRIVPKWETYFHNSEFLIVIPSNTYMHKLFRYCHHKQQFFNLNSQHLSFEDKEWYKKNI